VEAQVEAVLTTVDEDIPANFRSCDVTKEIQCLQLGKACGFVGIPNECLSHLPRSPLVRLTHSVSASAWSVLDTLEVSKNDRNPSETQNFRIQ
jgi:hypothetical protein